MSLALAPRARLTKRADAAVLHVQGYASLFGVADQAGDIVRQGAFRASLAARAQPVPMLVEHEEKLRAGFWSVALEDSRGLWVRGAIEADAPGAAAARRLIARGGDGLSIGFVTRLAHERAGAGRVLEDVELLEVSLVRLPMLTLARFHVERDPHARGESRAL